jgi:hypothetical protein
MAKFERERMLRQLQEDKRQTEQDVADRVARLEADPIAMADHLANEHAAFMRCMQSDDMVYKQTDAMIAAAAHPPQQWIDDDEFVRSVGEVAAALRLEFQSGDKILKQRIQELERQVVELREQLSIFNRVAASCDLALKTALAWMSKSK